MHHVTTPAYRTRLLERNTTDITLEEQTFIKRQIRETEYTLQVEISSHQQA
jgi:hypothetical protein